MAVCISPAAPAVTAIAPADPPVRVLRWLFRRDDEELQCELALTTDYSAYELRLAPRWNPVGVDVELFDDAISAFERLSACERLLVDEGWSLERFESAATLRT